MRNRGALALAVLVAVLSIVVVFATLLPLSTAGTWWIRALDFPRVQVLAIAVVAVVCGLVTPIGPRRWKCVGAALLIPCIVMQAAKVLPYTPLWPERSVAGSPSPKRSVRILVSNVRMDNRDSEKVWSVIRRHDPDIVVVLEADAWWQAQLSELAASRPHTVLVPQDNTYGLLLYSRLKLDAPKVEFLVESDVPSVRTGVELESGERFELYVVHPKPPAPSEAKDTDERDAELLIVGDRIADRGRPAVVAGDLNDVAWSRTTELFLETSGLLDPRIGRGLYSTFHAEHWFLRWPLDHVFHTEHFLLSSLERLETVGSDHFPILVHLTLDPDAPALQDAPEADAEDRRRASEKIEAPARDG